jgi:hypothetical protein
MNRIAILIDPWDFPFNGTVVSTRRFVAALRRLGYRLAIYGEMVDVVGIDEMASQLTGAS